MIDYNQPNNSDRDKPNMYYDYYNSPDWFLWLKLARHIPLIILCICLFGCSSIKNIFGKSSIKVEESKSKIEAVDDKISDTKENKLSQIGQFSYGISYALNNSYSNKLDIVGMLNQRVISLSIYPTLEQIKNMELMVNQLSISNQELLIIKDVEIKKLQTRVSELNNDKEQLTKSFFKQAKDIALVSDSNASEIDHLKGNFGLNAIFFGLKTLIIKLMWVIGSFILIYTILRFAAMSNPIAASIFQIFNLIGSWFINIIKGLAPDSIKSSGHIPIEIFNKYNDTLTRIVDVLQTTKTDVQTSELNKTLDSDHKAIVDDIKKKLLYV